MKTGTFKFKAIFNETAKNFPGKTLVNFFDPDTNRYYTGVLGKESDDPIKGMTFEVNVDGVTFQDVKPGMIAFRRKVPIPKPRTPPKIHQCADCRDGGHKNYSDDVRLMYVRDPSTKKFVKRAYVCSDHILAYEVDGYEIKEIKK